ncbi:MAG: hypothetical protein IJ760_07685 [Bacteroidales bacterium]|nr:hypothetical protein [Bacteroidales bacterium]
MTQENNKQFGYNISIVDHNNEKWVRVQAMDEDFIIAPHDLNDGKNNFNYLTANARLKELGLDTFNRKQGFIIATLIEEINAKLVEAGGDEFAEGLYVSSELWRPVGSSADSDGIGTWYFSGTYGCFNTYSRYYSKFRSRPVLNHTEHQSPVINNNNTDMKIRKFIKRILYVEYRLTVYSQGEVKPYNTYSTKRRLLRGSMNAPQVACWTLYKKGPFGLSEREIDFGYSREEAEKE